MFLYVIVLLTSFDSTTKQAISVEKFRKETFQDYLEQCLAAAYLMQQDKNRRINMRNFGLFVALSWLAISTMHLPKVQATTVFRLSSGHNIPIVGLGTHGQNGEQLENLLSDALDAGLRHIDTGFAYENEEAIGKSLKKWFAKGGKREDLFVTSKLPYFDIRASAVEKYLKLSLEKLGLQYVDLYLIHTPFGVVRKNDSYEVAFNDDGSVILDYQTDPVAVWKEMEKQVKAGRTKSIGLSNFNETQVTNIMKNAEIKPSVLQIEVHAYHQQKPLREFCKKHGIIVTAYAPLDSSGARKALHPDLPEKDFPNILSHPVVMEIAKNHNKSTAQVLLRHTVQGGSVVIPGSKSIAHLKDNLHIFDFELTDDQVKQLDDLDKGDRGKIFDYQFFKGIERHPLYPFPIAS